MRDSVSDRPSVALASLLPCWLIRRFNDAILSIATVEYRFGSVNRLTEPNEWLFDNGSRYVPGDTRRCPRNIGLVPRTTLGNSSQSNGMAEACVLKHSPTTSALI